MRARNYNHCALVVRDLEKACWFYGQLLGLATIDRPDFGFPGHWFQVGDSQLHLMVMDEEIPRTMRHLAFEVDDFPGAIAELGKNGLEIVEGPGKRVDGSDYLFCRDPDGNLVELTYHG